MITKLKAKLDKVFSQYIRLRGSQDGFAKCFTCGKVKEWKQMQCGHYVSRRFMSLRWDDKNCQAQCGQCNIYKSGNMDVFGRELQKKYGTDILKLLEIKKRNIMKLGKFEYEALIKVYQDKIKLL